MLPCCCLVTCRRSMRCCNNSEAAVLLGSCLLRSSSLRCTLRSCWKCLWLITIRRVALSLSANFLFPFFLSFFLFYLLGLVSMLSFHELSCALVFCAFRCSLWCSLVTCLVSSSKRTFRSQNGLHKHFFFTLCCPSSFCNSSFGATVFPYEVGRLCSISVLCI